MAEQPFELHSKALAGFSRLNNHLTLFSPFLDYLAPDYIFLM
jgi:hypothetical protein